MSAVIVSVVLISVFMIASPLAFGIGSLVIGTQNMGATCDHIVPTSFMSLSTWLIVYGSITIAFAVLAIAALFMLITGHAAFMIMLLVVLIPNFLFMFAWNIVGAVALFRDSYPCQTTAYPLWAMTLAVLIIQWIGMVAACCTGKSSKESN